MWPNAYKVKDLILLPAEKMVLGVPLCEHGLQLHLRKSKSSANKGREV